MPSQFPFGSAAVLQKSTKSPIKVYNIVVNVMDYINSAKLSFGIKL